MIAILDKTGLCIKSERLFPEGSFVEKETHQDQSYPRCPDGCAIDVQSQPALPLSRRFSHTIGQRVVHRTDRPLETKQ